MIAHIGGGPLEELLPSITGAGAGLLLARAWLRLHLRRRRARHVAIRHPSKDAARERLLGAFKFDAAETGREIGNR